MTGNQFRDSQRWLVDRIPKQYLYGLGAFVFGCGILVLAVGLFSGQCNWRHGMIGMTALW